LASVHWTEPDARQHEPVLACCVIVKMSATAMRNKLFFVFGHTLTTMC